MPTALIAGIDISACASRPSSLRSHCTWLPRPARHAVGDDLERAADRVAGLLRASIACLHRRRDRPRPRTARRRPARARGRCSKVTASGSATRAPPISVTWLATSMPTRREERARDGAGGDARGRFARARALEDVAQIVAAVLQPAGQIGMARAAAASPARAARPPALVRRLGLDAHRVLPVRPVAVANRAARSDCRASRRGARPTGSPRGPARSPSGGRGRSRAAGARDRARGRRRRAAGPPGTPSTMTTSAWPCDSPAVRNRNIGAPFYRSFCNVPWRRRGACDTVSRGSASCTIARDVTDTRATDAGTGAAEGRARHAMRHHRRPRFSRGSASSRARDLATGLEVRLTFVLRSRRCARPAARPRRSRDRRRRRARIDDAIARRASIWMPRSGRPTWRAQGEAAAEAVASSGTARRCRRRARHQRAVARAAGPECRRDVGNRPRVWFV